MKNKHMMNVVLITIDALRYDFVKSCCAKSKVSVTPNIDRLAKESLVFTQAISGGPSTPSSFRTLFTSAYNSGLNNSTAVEGVDGNTKISRLDGGLTITEILSQKGYTTAGFHSNPLLSSIFNYNRGFDYFYEGLPTFHNKFKVTKFQLILVLLNRLFKSYPYLPAEKLNKKILSWLKSAKFPFFLWVHYMDIHGPYIPKKGFIYLNKFKGEKLWRKAIRHTNLITKGEKNLLLNYYIEEIYHLDKKIGFLFNKFKDNLLFQNTLFIITADHGEEFGEHGDYSHGSKLYDELLHVPLIIKYPGCKGKMINEQVGLIDVSPTILDACKINQPEEFLGQSLLSYAEDNKIQARKVISEIIPPFDKEVKKVSLRNAMEKFIYDIVDDKCKLYDLKKDPKETNNLSLSEDKKVNKLKEKIKNHLKLQSSKKNRETTSQFIKGGGLLKERLKSLGYID